MDVIKKLVARPYCYIGLFFFCGFLVMYFGSSFSEEKSINVDNDTFTIQKLHIDIDGSKIAYYDSLQSNAKLSVILLHGMRFSKENWKELGTLDLLSELSYRVIAIDLPGYGDSQKLNNLSNQEFLRRFITKTDTEAAVLVSPSMSGQFALPLVFSQDSPLKGWIPIAPVGLTKHDISEYQSLKLPVLAVYGENDSQFRTQVEKYLGAIPGVSLKMVPGGSHPCYIDNPELWHVALLEFLEGFH